MPGFTPNYDESKVPAYTLPELLKTRAGDLVSTVADWEKTRRPELMALLAEYEYGAVPDEPAYVGCEVIEYGPALDGRAHRFQIRVHLSEDAAEPSIDVLLYAPAESMDAAPVFVGLNFAGNHATTDDPEVLLARGWLPARFPGVVDNRATEEGRGSYVRRWPVADIIDAGFAVATAYSGDIDPDYDDGFANGVHPLVDESPESRTETSWGTISAWAWGLSRILDMLQDFNMVVDPQRAIVIGHSRLGKTSLWAGANDPRFAAVVSSDSGCGGSALHRRCFGERIESMKPIIGYWFCQKHLGYAGREHELPIDQHQLLAMIAPRPLYIASASEDLWADPTGELLSAHHAAPAWSLYGIDASLPAEPPPADTVVGDHTRYHRRTGPHDIVASDWKNFLAWAKKHV